MDRDNDFDFNDILLDEKLYKEKDENILFYGISQKTLTNEKPLSIRFNKINGFIKVRAKVRCLVLLDYGQFDKTCHRIKYVISEKNMVLQIALIKILKNQN